MKERSSRASLFDLDLETLDRLCRGLNVCERYAASPAKLVPGYNVSSLESFEYDSTVAAYSAGFA